ncbi:hypothetical protein QTP88_024329 [Uroleucon formosanum]
MPVSCVAFGCSNRFETGKSIHFFRFPIKNEELTQLWVNAIRKNFNPTQWSRICSVHFTENDFIIRPDAERSLLKIHAVHSEFPSFPKYYQNTNKKPRKPPTLRTNKVPIPADESNVDNTCLEVDNTFNVDNTLTFTDVEVQTSNTYTTEVKLKQRIKSLHSVIDLFKNESKNKTKQLALTLHYYSPKAYHFCRTILSLPHPSSITNWPSSVNAEHGFFQEVFIFIKKNIPPEDYDCNLTFDAIVIRYCDFGNIQVESQEIAATESLVFMLVYLNGKRKFPIGYFLQCKISASSVTCDGTSTNLSSMKQLGCKIKDRKVFYFYSNKLTVTHMEWKKNIMKVKLAAQTLSSSVADALEFFQSSNDIAFNNCAETVKFIRTIDRIFDFLNTRHPFGKGYKILLYKSAIENMKKTIIQLVDYLLILTNINGTLICELKYCFQNNGHNNNSNVLEFITAGKQILLKNSVASSYTANCLAFDKSSNESVFEIRWAKRKSGDTCYLHDESILEETEKEEEIPDIFMNEAYGFGMVKENILYYICDCLTCCDNLLEKCNKHNNYTILNENSKLVAIKNRGGLVKSSSFDVKVVKFVEKTPIDLSFIFKLVKMLNSSLTSKIIIFAKFIILVYVKCLMMDFRKP